MTKINTSLSESPNGNNRHRKEKSRSSRGSLRSEIQVSGEQIRNGGKERRKHQKNDPGSASSGHQLKQQKHRQDDQLGRGNNSISSRERNLSDQALRSSLNEQRARVMLEKLTQEHLINNVNAILRVDGSIKAFGRYTIKQHGLHYQVYRGSTLALEPSSAKIAISWCIAEKYGKYSLAQSLEYLDQEVERRNSEIEYYRNTIAKSQDYQKRFVVADRLNLCLAQLKYAREQLDKCLNSAKYWQLKGFKDETARIGLKNQITI